MGTITRSFANNITTSGVLLPASLTNNSIVNVTAYNASVATGGMKLISSQTASNSASISFTTGIDSTYKEYQFYFINIRPATDQVPFMFNLSTNGGSTYAVTKTTSVFRAFHQEDDTVEQLSYYGTYDLAQSTADQAILWSVGNASDESGVGTLQLFNPSSTTYVKHYIFTGNEYEGTNFTINGYVGGYGNTTSAVNAVRFQFQSGNIADGTILMYGIV
jgi:hypothetical protein